MLNFVTLFNSNYLSRGLVLYQSLEKQCTDFHLYVIAFDDATYNYFQKFPQKNLTAISLKQFEDEKLLSIKSTRSAGEYCWTCTASTVLYCINTFNLDHCVYIDADMCFYSNPQSLFDEWGNKSILITEHRYTTKYDQSDLSGTYCVQFVGFKNDLNGIAALNYWRESCIEWCYAWAEDGKFGDQKYLDDWTARFNNVHVLQHLGGGIAPWNVQQYKFFKKEKYLIGQEIETSKEFNAVFFHFHGLKFYEDDIVSLTDCGYEISKVIIELFYKPYVQALMATKRKINKMDSSFNPNGSSGQAPHSDLNFETLKKYYIEGVKNSRRNVLGMYLFKKIKQHYFFKTTKF
jgi:hypothetical protein